MWSEMMKNFPSFINEKSSQEQVRDYLKSTSKNERVKNPQFHAVISTKFQEHTKEDLTNVADEFMKEMGYGNQPFIVVFHNDTDNNHIHIVSTRIDKQSGKKIKDNYPKMVVTLDHFSGNTVDGILVIELQNFLMNNWKNN